MDVIVPLLQNQSEPFSILADECLSLALYRSRTPLRHYVRKCKKKEDLVARLLQSLARGTDYSMMHTCHAITGRQGRCTVAEDLLCQFFKVTESLDPLLVQR